MNPRFIGVEHFAVSSWAAPGSSKHEPAIHRGFMWPSYAPGIQQQEEEEP